jgi:peroxiredoxin
MRIRPVLAAWLIVSAVASGAEVPRKAPEFAVQMPKGGQILLSQHKGKVVCLEFLYTTCPHCQHASQLMSKLQTEYGPKGFQALGVAFNDFANMLVPDFVRDFKVNYPIGVGTREAVHTFLQHNPDHLLNIPQVVIIDRKGVIRHQSQARNDTVSATEPFLRTTIEKLLKEPGPQKARPSTSSFKPAAR